LLSAAMEAAAGKPFLEFEQEQVFTPLVFSTRALISPPTSFRKGALLFRRQRRAHAQLDVRGQQLQMGWRRIHSTSEDLVRFGSVLFQPGYLKAESLAMLFTPQKTKDGKETNYGMGWFIGKSKSGKRIFEHSGGSVGGLPTLSSIPIRTWSLRLYATMTAKAGKARKCKPCEAFEK